jgi:hypothetical protein
MTTFEFGAMSSKYSCKAENKLTAYVTIVAFYYSNAFAVVIYSPEECKADNWTSFDGKIAARLHEIFGGKPEDYPQNDAFNKYADSHIEEIRACYKTIKQLI